ncbi:piggyBac transposable element-derived protein 3-like [Amphibalanus amphitrite]|uniref:piggyBac transposable element-derived protein 3-like n=1 Tax=Amphibalanus amphitrite TaxID=1232801 RepID=UPI001C90983E|nr:piggyBac transposable element-derived protein 3-like [Amphibalanus amphitrite]
MVEEDASGDEADVILIPPEGDVSDGYSGPEDEGEGDPDHLSAPILKSEAELQRRRSSRAETTHQPTARRHQAHHTVTWMKPAPSSGKPTRLFPEASFSQFSGMSPNELVTLFLGEEIFDLTIKESTLYALRNGRQDPQLSREDIAIFIGILVLTSYLTAVNTRFYWQEAADTHNELICQAMTRNRFDTIKRNLHFCSEEDPADRYWKLRPLIKILQVKYMEHFVPQQAISHDEAMIAYFGRHGLKQAIRNKPIRFGFKAWAQNTSDGYLLAFDFYQGRGVAEHTDDNVQLVGKSGATVLDLLEHMKQEFRELPFQFFVDNYFMSIPLMQEMTKRGYDVTGTIRENRIPGTTGLSATKEFRKKERGMHQAVTSRDGNVILVRWQDNAPVTLASTCYGDVPPGKVRRYSRVQKRHVEVDRPHVVGKYNEMMGGTDRMDQNVNHCRIAVKGKKWWWPIFTWLVDTAVHNAWRLYCRAGGTMTYVQFRREYACTILRRWARGSKPMMNRNLAAPGSEAIRFDGMGHIIIKAPSRGTCRNEGCTAKVGTKCVKCAVFLCVNCFAGFHGVAQ